MTDYEESIAFLGQWGPFQQTVFFLLCSSAIPNGFTGMSIVFIGDTPPHRCLIPAGSNISAEWRNHSIPWEEDQSGTLSLSKCSRYRLDVIKNLSNSGYVPGIDVNVSELPLETCLDGWKYDQGTYISTIVTEWDLVCDEKWRNPLTSSIFFCGVLTGSFLSGQLSDRFGRKIVLFVTMGVQTVFTFIQVFSLSWSMFCGLHFIVGMGQISNYVAAFVLGTELLSPEVRMVFSTLGLCVSFALGYMLLPLGAYLIREWRMLLLVLTLPGVLYVPLWWFIPESPRWLLSQGRVEEAEAILRRAARQNQVQAPDVIFQPPLMELASGKLETYNICDLLRSRNICLVSVTLWIVWTVISIGYFALSLNTSNLHGSSYLNCFVSAAIEVPAYLLAWLLFRFCGRRPSLCWTLFLGGVMMFFTLLLPPGLSWISTTLEMLGKFGVTAAFSILYAFTAELYPTVLRNTAVGVCSMASRVGSISAPYFIYLGEYSKSLPNILIGGLTILSGLLSLLLPESHGVPLPDTVDHMQSFPGCKKREVCKCTCPSGEEDERAMEMSRQLTLKSPSADPCIYLSHDL
ncbi:organic cation/carnitine transporter 2-like isoform X1 [Osmerus eperlanus]|uniref:organic cation/carnitine transporter 2-like isoform X1 n=1 Tax=Osmerus eperlanus TaxID=29151 RepID=UPI002E10C022